VWVFPFVKPDFGEQEISTIAELHGVLDRAGVDTSDILQEFVHLKTLIYQRLVLLGSLHL